MDDEWFIVWLLWTATQHRSDVTVHVRDSDGNFLLIEVFGMLVPLISCVCCPFLCCLVCVDWCASAFFSCCASRILPQTAAAIPSWLHEDNSQYRVWLRQGLLHIIPIPRTPAELCRIPSRLTAESALQFVRASDSHPYTEATPAVQRLLRRRFDKYPSSALAQNRFWRRVIVPRAAAEVLRRVPQVLNRAIDMFYLRDPVSLRDAAVLHKFAVEPYQLDEKSAPATKLSPLSASATSSTTSSTTDRDVTALSASAMVATRVRLTHALYAMLAHQQFHPPKRYPMPPATSRYTDAATLGLKLTCALEMLYADACRARPSPAPSATGTLEGVCTSPL
jgi:hypothetical protein